MGSLGIDEIIPNIIEAPTDEALVSCFEESHTFLRTMHYPFATIFTTERELSGREISPKFTGGPTDDACYEERELAVVVLLPLNDDDDDP